VDRLPCSSTILPSKRRDRGNEPTCLDAFLRTKAKPFHHPKNIFAWYNNEGQIAWLNKKWSDRSAKLLPDASNVTTPHQLDLVSQPCIIPNGANHEILVSATSEQSMNAWIKRNSVFSIFSFVCRGGMEPFLPMLGSTQFRKADP